MAIPCMIPSPFLNEIPHDKLKKILDLYLRNLNAGFTSSYVTWPLPNDLTILCLLLIICKVEIIVVPSSDDYCKCQWSSTCVVLRTESDTQGVLKKCYLLLKHRESLKTFSSRVEKYHCEYYSFSFLSTPFTLDLKKLWYLPQSTFFKIP